MGNKRSIQSIIGIIFIYLFMLVSAPVYADGEIEADIAQLENQIGTLEGEIEELEEENANGENDEIIEETEQEIEKLEQNIEQLEEKLEEDKDDEISENNFEGDKEALKEEINEIKQNLQESTTELKALKAENIEGKNDEIIADIQEEIEDEKDRVQEIIDENRDDVKALLQQQKQLLNTSSNTLSDEVTRASESIQVSEVKTNSGTKQTISYTLTPKISSEKLLIKSGQEIFLDSYQSTYPTGTKITWNLGDGTTIKDLRSITHLYKKSGDYNVELILEFRGKTHKDTINITVANNIITLMSDSSTKQKDLDAISKNAKEKGVFLNILQIKGTSSDFINEELLSDQIDKNKESINLSDYIVSLSEKVAGIDGFTLIFQNKDIDIPNTTMIVMSENNHFLLSKYIQSASSKLKDKNIILTKKTALPELFNSSNNTQFKNNLTVKKIQYEVITQVKKTLLSPVLLLSKIVNLLIIKNVSPNIISLLLMLPIAVTIVVVFRQIIGITSFGVFTPSLLALTFLSTGLNYGLIMLFAILLGGLLLRALLNNVRLLSIPRIAIVMIFVSIIMFILLGIGASFDLPFVATIGAFPMLIIASIIEKFTSAQQERSTKDAMILLGNTLIITLVSYFVMNWELLKSLIITYPELTLLLIPLNIFLGRWTGIRLIEYIRFKDLLRNTKENA